jgi:DNA-binding CsgD family transcriptional regulator
VATPPSRQRTFAPRAPPLHANVEKSGREFFAAASPEQVRRLNYFSAYGRLHQIDFTDRQTVALHLLDRFSIGIILLDSAGRILSANAAARLLISNGQRLGRRASVLERLPTALSRQLSDQIEQAQGAATVVMSMPHAGDGASLMLLLSKVHSHEAAQFGRGFQDAASILFLHDPTRRIDLPVAWMMDAYGLTLAEARAALSASSGMTVEGMARQLQLSPNTIKTHLRRVFAKTGTRRQAELARLVALLSLVREPMAAGANT